MTRSCRTAAEYNDCGLLVERRLTMSKPLLPDGLWQEIEPLLPPPNPRRFRFPGRKPLARRKVLTGIVFVLKTGMSWDDLPPDLGLGCGRTCHDYLQKLQEAGVWEQLHTRLLSQLNQVDGLDWNLGIVDSISASTPSLRPCARGSRLRFRAPPTVAALDGHHSPLWSTAHRAWQWFGYPPLGNREDKLLVAQFWPVAPPTRQAARIANGVCSLGLCVHLLEISNGYYLSSFFPDALSQSSPSSCGRE